jgi:4-hydroxybenzoate polyprenyltransferase
MRTIKALVESLRPTQWVKNLLVFAGLIFGHKATDPAAVTSAVEAFLLFCAAASGVYLLNDIRDREADRRHPLKRNRPIASGRLPLPVAISSCVLLMAGSGALSFTLGREFGFTLVAFLVLQLFYSFGLKRLVILDVFAVAMGFVLRAVAGAFAVDVEISPWLLICSLTLALFLALAKRRHEVVLLDAEAKEHRASLSHYSAYYLDQMISVVTATTVMAYALYTMAPNTVAKFQTQNLIFTLPFVIYGVFRYLYLVHQKEEGGNPTRMFLTDPAILVNTALWLAAAAWIVYG